MHGNLKTRPAVWLVGDCDHPDLAEATDWLRTAYACSSAREAEIPPQLPDAIVFCQPRPGAVRARDLEAWHRRAPLARLVLLTGPWCDGETRSSRHATGVVRVRWHQWRERLPGEVTGRVARLPRTATEAERLESQLRALTRGERPRGRIAIHTLSRERYRALAGACAVLGWQAAWLQAGDASPTEFSLLLIDGWPKNPPNAQALPRLLLLAYPRPEDFQWAAESGFHAVIGEPLTLPALATALAEAAPGTCHPAARPSVA